MLFLNTCEVKAAYYSNSVTVNGHVSANSIDWSSGGTISQGHGAITPYAQYWLATGEYHFEIPFVVNLKFQDYGLSYPTASNQYITIRGYTNSLSSSGATIDNLYIRDTNGNIVYKNGSSVNFKAYTDTVNNLVYSSYSQGTNLTFYVCGDALLTDRGQFPVSDQSVYSATQIKDFSITYNYSAQLSYATSSEIESAKVSVSDNGAQNRLDNVIEQNENAQETREEQLESQKSFFGSFFDNLIHVFVPDSGYFEDWFSRLNDLLAEKLGMLYAPFDLLITTLEAIYDSDNSESGIPFPGIKWEDTYIVEPFTFSFESLGNSEGITKLRDTVYFGTDVVLLFAFLYLLEQKIKEILEG